ncbi:MAG: hypothetical protein Q7R73_01850 [bacterium]|nr:hypothetical protein [bacterium]
MGLVTIGLGGFVGDSIDFAGNRKQPGEIFRDTGKLCPVCDEEYLASGPFVKGKSHGLDTTYCIECGKETVWAYRPKCHCGATIDPRDRHCQRNKHRVCKCDSIFCPLWHDYSEKFVEK